MSEKTEKGTGAGPPSEFPEMLRKRTRQLAKSSLFLLRAEGRLLRAALADPAPMSGELARFDGGRPRRPNTSEDPLWNPLRSGILPIS